MEEDEIFDVVDEKDSVIGQESRAVVHRMKLLHRAVHILIFNSQGQIFLQKRSMQKDNFPGLWDSSAAGHLDTGENYEAACIREVGEELGIQCEIPPEKLFKIDACSQTGQEFVWVYRINHNGPFILHPEEIDYGDWLDCDEVTAWIKEKPEDFASAFIYIWELYIKR